MARSKKLTPDQRNANRGTERGANLLEKSLRQYGAGRSIVTDKHGVVIVGNKTLEQAVDLGIPTRTVETDGTELIAVQRNDLDLKADPRARELAYADNRVGELDLDWDIEQIRIDVGEGVKVGEFWFDDELAEMLGELPDGADGKECDGSIADEVEFHECPECHHRWPK